MRNRLFWALGLALLLRLPAFCWPAISDDEAIYDAMAQVINQGGVMYRDVVDHKPPGLAYTYAAVEELAGASHAGPRGMAAVHALGALAALLTAWGLYGVARELLPAGTRSWAPLLYAVASTAKCAYDGLAVNGELLMNVPTVFAVWAVLVALRQAGLRRVALDVLAGALAGAAALYKWQALLVGLAFPFFGPNIPVAFGKRLLTRGPAWLVGLSLPLAATALYFFGQGALPDAVLWGLRFNSQYLAEGPGMLWALQRLAVQFAAVVLPSLLLYACAVRSACERPQLGLLVWAAGALGAVCLGGRFFGHYFLQLELPLCLLAAPVVARVALARPGRVAAALAVPAMVFAALALTPKGTRALLDGSDPNWEAAGRAIAVRTEPGDALFVWGNAPLIYHHAQRAMGTRFSFCNYLTGLSPGTPSEYDPTVRPEASAGDAWPALLADLEQRRPTWVLDTASAGWKGYSKFPIQAYEPLQAHLAAHYRPQALIEGAVLYRRL